MSNFTYTSAFNLSLSPFNSAIGSSSSSAFAPSAEDDDDACSICLEAFTLQDPATVTSCKHEYHLQCIIEWSQRSKECPICWQLFVLRDPVSQELLASVEKERLLKSSNISSPPSRSIYDSLEDFRSDEESQFSSFNEQFLRHFTDAVHRPYMLPRRESQRSSSMVSSNDPAMIDSTDMANLDYTSVISHGGHQNSSPCLSPGPMTSSPASGYSFVRAATNNMSRISPPLSPSQSPNPSEVSSLPEAIKSKLAAASVKYKESISKSKQGLKEKLLARNNSVKELSKGVQREMNAGIAGVSRMIERLDLASKRFGGSAHVSTTSTTTSSKFNFSFKGKHIEKNNTTAKSNNGNKSESHNLQGGETC